MQDEYTKRNEEAWNQMAYDAWIYRFGTPSEAAEKIMKDPCGRLGSIYKHLIDVDGKKIANLLGSNGNKAAALALLGGNVTIVDFASENARYAKELAKECGVAIRYVISDVLKLPDEELSEDYDIVLTELGILHYFLDLEPFFNVAAKLLKKGGRLILHDFHPVSTKLITSKGKKHKVTGDYFSSDMEVTDVAYMKYVPSIESLSDDEKAALPKVYLRKWTIGEIVTAIGSQGLCIKILEEEESVKPDDKGIPKLFTIVAYKI